MSKRSKPTLHVLAIGGPQQFAHFIPVACELACRGHFDVKVFVANYDDRNYILDFFALYNLYEINVEVTVIQKLFESLLPAYVHKISKLVLWSKVVRRCDLILCAERTSTLLKRLPGYCPPIVHIPHGAGDRAVGFEKRFQYFDLVIVSGEKDKRRLVSSELVRDEICKVGGPVKISTILRSGAGQRKFFDNDRPTIFYNPHFHKKYGSSPIFFNKIVNFVINSGKYNLIVAPHVRLKENMSRSDQEYWSRFSNYKSIIVDLGSHNSYNMSYSLSSDMYIGDVSSQVYEFCIKPRPCLFINTAKVEWKSDPSFAMWHLGDVISEYHEVPDAIINSFSNHGLYIEKQKQRVSEALDGFFHQNDDCINFNLLNPVVNSAEIIEDYYFKR